MVPSVRRYASEDDSPSLPGYLLLVGIGTLVAAVLNPTRRLLRALSVDTVIGDGSLILGSALLVSVAATVLDVLLVHSSVARAV